MAEKNHFEELFHKSKWKIAKGHLKSFSTRLEEGQDMCCFVHQQLKKRIAQLKGLKGLGFILTILPLTIPSFNSWSHYDNIGSKVKKMSFIILGL